MGPTKPGHDESTSLMTISSPPVPGGDPSTGVRKRQTSDHRTRPPPRPRRNGGIADPEGFAIAWSGLVRGGHCFRSDGSSDTSPDFDPRRFPRRLGDILGASAAVLHVVPECDLRRVPEPLRGDLDHAHVLAALRFESVHENLLMGPAQHPEVALDPRLAVGVEANVPEPHFGVVHAPLARDQRYDGCRIAPLCTQVLVPRGEKVHDVDLGVLVDIEFRANNRAADLLWVHHPERPTDRVEVLEIGEPEFFGPQSRSEDERDDEPSHRGLPSVNPVEPPKRIL